MKKPLLQWLGLLGILSLLSYGAAVIFAPLAYPGYNWMAQAVSDLAHRSPVPLGNRLIADPQPFRQRQLSHALLQSQTADQAACSDLIHSVTSRISLYRIPGQFAINAP